MSVARFDELLKKPPARLDDMMVPLDRDESEFPYSVRLLERNLYNLLLPIDADTLQQ